MAGAGSNYNKRLIGCCDEHPDAPLIEDYRVGEMSCTECGKILLGYTSYIYMPPNISKKRTHIGNDDGLFTPKVSRDDIAKNPSSSSYLTNTFSAQSSSTGETKRPSKKRANGFDFDAVYHRIEIMAKQLLDGNQEVIDLAKKILCKNVQIFNTTKTCCTLPDSFEGVCLLAAFLKTKIPRTMEDIQPVSNTKSPIAKDHIVLNLQHCQSITNFKDLIPKFGEKLRLPKDIINDTLHIATLVTTFIEVNGSRIHYIVAATAIYMASQKTPEHHLCVNEVAKISCIRASEIRNLHTIIIDISRNLL